MELETKETPVKLGGLFDGEYVKDDPYVASIKEQFLANPNKLIETDKPDAWFCSDIFSDYQYKNRKKPAGLRFIRSADTFKFYRARNPELVSNDIMVLMIHCELFEEADAMYELLFGREDDFCIGIQPVFFKTDIRSRDSSKVVEYVYNKELFRKYIAQYDCWNRHQFKYIISKYHKMIELNGHLLVGIGTMFGTKMLQMLIDTKKEHGDYTNINISVNRSFVRLSHHIEPTLFEWLEANTQITKGKANRLLGDAKNFQRIRSYHALVFIHKHYNFDKFDRISELVANLMAKLTKDSDFNLEFRKPLTIALIRAGVVMSSSNQIFRLFPDLLDLVYRNNLLD